MRRNDYNVGLGRLLRKKNISLARKYPVMVAVAVGDPFKDHLKNISVFWCRDEKKILVRAAESSRIGRVTYLQNM
jgi:hypothetical protein